MTFKSLINSHASSVYLNLDHFAEEVTQYPGGSGASVTVTALVDRPDPSVREQRGQETRNNPMLHVNTSVSVSKSDRWEIDGVIYETIKVGLADKGLVSIELTHVDKETQGDASPGVL